MYRSTAWPLTWVYAGLVVYASLYPFEGWRDQGVALGQFVTAPWPRYWTWFDVISNVLGYMPLGFFLCLGLIRNQTRQPIKQWVSRHPVLTAFVLGSALSWCLEALQSYLPVRVPSRLDGVLNALGAWVGAVLALGLARTGALSGWSRYRTRWLVSDASSGLVLLALWPLALLFPAAVPMGLGQVFERLENTLAEVLVGTAWLEWLPLRETELQPLLPATEAFCVALGVLAPCLLGMSLMPKRWPRWVLLGAVLAAGVGASALSAALSYGPVHAWAWLTPQVGLGLCMAVFVASLLVWRQVPMRVSAALLCLALGVDLSIINQAPEGAYFAQTLQAWEQGRFIRFHGLGQWLGWLWPYATLLVVMSRFWADEDGREESWPSGG